MATSKTRVAAYLNPLVEDKFREFQKSQNIPNDSEALNLILSSYFGVSKEVVNYSQLRKLVRQEVDAYLNEETP